MYVGAGVDIIHSKPDCPLHELESYIYTEVARRFRTRVKLVKRTMLHVPEVIKVTCQNEGLAYKIFGKRFLKFNELSMVPFLQDLEAYLHDDLDKSKEE